MAAATAVRRRRDPRSVIEVMVQHGFDSPLDSARAGHGLCGPPVIRANEPHHRQEMGGVLVRRHA